MTQRRIDINPFNAIGVILLLVFGLWVLGSIFSIVYTIMKWASPFLLIGAAITDYTVITDYVKWVFKMLKENPIMGIGAIFLTIFGFPVIAGFLFGKAWVRNKVSNMAAEYENETQGELVDYEEVEDVTDVEEEFESLELPERQPEPIRQQRNNTTDEADYEQLFDDE